MLNSDGLGCHTIIVARSISVVYVADD